MADCTFTVSFAGPLVTVQDAGRRGHLRHGVSASGPMDRLAFAAAHAALGNTVGLTAIEISLGGLILQCTSGAVTVAITGGDFSVDHAGQKSGSWVVQTVQKGERLTIRAGKTGSWAYLAFAGHLSAREWLGSQSTHSTSGFGGGTLQAGQALRIHDCAVREDRLGEIAKPDFQPAGAFRVVLGPQEAQFQDCAVTRFLAEAFTVSDAYDRMGMRLTGPELLLNAALSIPSEPIVRGSVQVSGDGVPTVLLADHQTTGGYPKIATLLSCEADRIAQQRAGQGLRFSSLSAAEAVETARQYAADKIRYLDEVSIPKGTLEQRLMRENLNHGWVEQSP